MAVSAEFREYVLDQLRAVTPVTPRAMFGGVGLYSRGSFFGLIAEDVVYFKVDEGSYPAYRDRGSKAFDPFGKGKPVGASGYYELPEDVLENEDELRTWTRDAIAVAKRAKKKK